MTVIEVIYSNREVHKSEVNNIDGLIHYIKVCQNSYGDKILSIVYYKED